MPRQPWSKTDTEAEPGRFPRLGFRSRDERVAGFEITDLATPHVRVRGRESVGRPDCVPAGDVALAVLVVSGGDNCPVRA